MTQITVQNMHCHSCVSLVQMELSEDPKLSALEPKVSLLDAEQQLGQVSFSETLDESEIQRATELINGIGSYRVQAINGVTL